MINMIERLKNKFGVNKPIFTSEILEEMSEFSRAYVFRLLKEAASKGELLKFEKGVYYVPTSTMYGKSNLTLEQVISKKYIKDKDDVFGIYSGLMLKYNFSMTNQVPMTIEIITNNESTPIRRMKKDERTIVLRKSRTPINKKNVYAYTILELFNNINLEQYKKDKLVKKEITQYISKNKIKAKDVLELAVKFPNKATKNIVESGIVNEFT